MRFRLSCPLVILALGVVPASAQDHAAAPPPVYTFDVGDLWHMVRHRPVLGDTGSGRRFLVFAPSIGSKPSTGVTVGLSGNVAFFKGGDAATTRISTFTGGLKVSQKRQLLFGSRLSLFTANDKWFILGENRLSWMSENTYALGTDAPAASRTNLKFDVARLYESAYREVRPGLFVGGGVNFSSHWHVRSGTSTGIPAWQNSAYLAYSEAHGFSATRQDSGGAGMGLRYDTRDNLINSAHGSLASATYRAFFDGFLGGDSTWQELALDARTYRAITPGGRQKLAFWFLGDMVTGGTAPYWDLPATATDGRSARGYTEGRYRGERLLYWETEYRATLTGNGLLGMVLFANATTVSNLEEREHLFESWAPAAGFGFRVLLNKHSRTNLCTDYAWGKEGSHGFYLAIQEAF